MIRTYGLTHIALRVADLDRSAQFYQRVFGTREMYRQENFIQVQTPDTRDIIVFEKTDKVIPNNSGILHFGFRMVEPGNIQQVIDDVEAAGGRIKETGEFIKGEPYVFFYDPDGHEIEVWYEQVPPELSSFC